MTHFNGLNMEIQWVFTFLKNLKPLVCKISANLQNSMNFIRLCAKNEYKNYNRTPRVVWTTQLLDWLCGPCNAHQSKKESHDISIEMLL